MLISVFCFRICLALCGNTCEYFRNNFDNCHEGGRPLGGLSQKSPHQFRCDAAALIAALPVMVFVTATHAHADGHAQGDMSAPRMEIFSGVGLTQNSIFGYAGAVWAFGASVEAQGPRVMAITGAGAYDYDGALPGVAGPVSFDGDVALARFLGGYQWQRGEWTLKAYAGVGFETHDLSPGDPANSVNGSEIGAVGQIELWRNLGEASWVSLDASYADVFASYWTQVRVGRRVNRRISAGVESGALGNEEYDSVRAGGFMRAHLGKTELTLSGGVSGDYLAEDFGAYATFGFYRKF